MARPVIVAVALLSVFVSCGGDAEAPEAAAADGSIGAAADASAADRTIEIEATDDLTFDPATVSAQRGETITFRVTNVGRDDHEFMLGDEEMHAEHDQEMAQSMHVHDHPNSIYLAPGETKEMTWNFGGADVIFGCHVPGHYDGGMRGIVQLSG